MGDPSRPTRRSSKVSFPGTFLLLHSKVFIYAYCTIVGGGEDIHDISFPFGYSKHAADPELQIKSVTLRRSFAHKEYGVSGTGTRGRYYYVSPLGGTQKDRQTPLLSQALRENVKSRLGVANVKLSLRPRKKASLVCPGARATLYRWAMSAVTRRTSIKPGVALLISTSPYVCIVIIR